MSRVDRHRDDCPLCGQRTIQAQTALGHRRRLEAQTHPDGRYAVATVYGIVRVRTLHPGEQPHPDETLHRRHSSVCTMRGLPRQRVGS